MGNSGARLLPAASVLKLVNSDAPVATMEPPEGGEELESSLKALGVDSTGVSVAGEHARVAFKSAVPSLLHCRTAACAHASLFNYLPHSN